MAMCSPQSATPAQNQPPLLLTASKESAPINSTRPQPNKVLWRMESANLPNG